MEEKLTEASLSLGVPVESWLHMVIQLGIFMLRFLLGCLFIGSMILLGLQAWSWTS
jgi:hypothetical protein